MAASGADFESKAAWGFAQDFFYRALTAVAAALPQVVQRQLELRGDDLPDEANLIPLRVALWESIEADQMGTTPAGAATRAAIFACNREESYDPAMAISVFSSYFLKAGLPEAALVGAFKSVWPGS
jgi:hypothetical protein